MTRLHDNSDNAEGLVMTKANGKQKRPVSDPDAQVARLRQVAAVAALKHAATELSALVSRINADVIDIDAFLELRAKVGELSGDINAASAKILEVAGLTSAQARMRQYLLNHLGEEVTGLQLGGVACIGEWARRTRELDVEQGLDIKVGPKDGLSTDGYMLASADPNSDRAMLWQLKNRIRKMPGSAQERMLTLLRERFPAAVHRSDLDYVAKIVSRDRRKRDLEEAGWRIVSSETDPTMDHGWYRLDSLERGPSRTRESLKLREELLRRVDFTCEKCGYRLNKHDARPLQVHHKQFLRDGGNDEVDNLLVVCRPCHVGIHALDKVSSNMIDDELLNPAADPLMRPN